MEEVALRFLGVFPEFPKENFKFFMSVCLSVPPSVRPPLLLFAWNNSDRTQQIFMKFDI
jgi:hypothetical protein